MITCYQKNNKCVHFFYTEFLLLLFILSYKNLGQFWNCPEHFIIKCMTRFRFNSNGKIKSYQKNTNSIKISRSEFLLFIISDCVLWARIFSYSTWVILENVEVIFWHSFLYFVPQWLWMDLWFFDARYKHLSCAVSKLRTLRFFIRK